MKCQKCRKLFSEAGNIRDYEIICPHCSHIQKSNENQKLFKLRKLKKEV